MKVKRHSIMQPNMVILKVEHMVEFSKIYWYVIIPSSITPLGQDEFVELLINRGSNAKLTDENRNTALHLAVKEGSLKNFCSDNKISLIKYVFLLISYWPCENPWIVKQRWRYQ